MWFFGALLCGWMHSILRPLLVDHVSGSPLFQPYAFWGLAFSCSVLIKSFFFSKIKLKIELMKKWYICLQKLEFTGMTETKQLDNMKMIPELRGRSANMESLTITNFGDCLFDATFNLSSLKELRLCDLPELWVVWKGSIQVVNFQNLTQLEVISCGRLRYIFSSPIMARNLPQLSSLKIWDCERMEGILEKDETSPQDHQPTCFLNLISVDIKMCASLKSLFPVRLLVPIGN